MGRRVLRLPMLAALLLALQVAAATVEQYPPRHRRQLQAASGEAVAPADAPSTDGAAAAAAPAPAPALAAALAALYGSSTDNDTADEPAAVSTRKGRSTRAAARLPRALPALPDWAIEAGEQLEGVAQRPIRRSALAHGAQVAEAANAGGERLDVVMMGDSITALLWLRHRELWDDAWAGWQAEPLGLPGGQVQDLAWLVGSGRWALAEDPRVILLLIGINNPPESDPGRKLGWLLDYLAAAHPSSRLVVLAPLPAKLPRREALLRATRAAVAARPDVWLSECGEGMDPRSRADFADGLHPSAGGYATLLSCLVPQLEPLLDASLAEEASATAAAAARQQLAAMQAAGA